MPTLDFSHLSQEERLHLIGELWDSLDSNAVPVTPAQKAELELRLSSLQQDSVHARNAADVLADLRKR